MGETLPIHNASLTEQGLSDIHEKHIAVMGKVIVIVGRTAICQKAREGVAVSPLIIKLSPGDYQYGTAPCRRNLDLKIGESSIEEIVALALGGIVSNQNHP